MGFGLVLEKVKSRQVPEKVGSGRVPEMWDLGEYLRR